MSKKKLARGWPVSPTAPALCQSLPYCLTPQGPSSGPPLQADPPAETPGHPDLSLRPSDTAPAVYTSRLLAGSTLGAKVSPHRTPWLSVAWAFPHSMAGLSSPGVYK